MKKFGKVLVWLGLALVVVLALGITFTIGWRPFIGPQARTLTLGAQIRQHPGAAGPRLLYRQQRLRLHRLPRRARLDAA